MARQELKDLYHILIEERFDFVPQGEMPLKGLYKRVKELYPELCDDDYLCSMNCKNKSNHPYGQSPEWKHTVRAVMKKMREQGTVTHGSSRGIWLFGVVGGVTAEGSGHEVMEGRTLFKLHRTKERKPAIVHCKKRLVLTTTGHLVCEVCDFDFEFVYGRLGERYAECHHCVPLSELNGKNPTSLDDLAIVCSNCHRMLHRSQPMLSVGHLRALVLDRRSAHIQT